MRNKHCIQWILLLVFVALLILSPFEVKADGPNEESSASNDGSNGDGSSIDWSGFSYDELLLIRDNLNEYIHEMERQYAIENGNRIITLNEGEVTLYNKKTFALQPEVKRVVEDAPEKTSFVWKSSDESVARVSNTGVVTGVGYGNATITCTASDDEYIFAESVFHVVLPVSKLTLEPSDVKLLLSENDHSGETASLFCAVTPDNAYIKDVTWSSSNPDIVTVDEEGVLHAVSAGTATITVRSDDPESNMQTATCRVTVLQAITSISLDKTSATININATENLSATIYPENASNKKVIWTSSDPSIATVSNSGAVRAVAPGTATITCTSDDGSNVSAECEIRCIQMVTNIRFDVNERTVIVNKDKFAQLNVVVSPDNATDKSLTWSSSNPTIVFVTSTGKIQGISGGAATITCTANDGSGKTASIEVYVPSIAVSQTEYKVTSKNGLDIDLRYYGLKENFNYTMAPQNLCDLRAKQKGSTVTLSVIPNKAGTVTVTLKDSSDRRSDTKITITIEHSACYDATSYPIGNYSDILRNPSAFNKKNMSIKGKVVQIQSSWGSTFMRVATRRGYDDVFYITCSDDVAKGIIEDDYITVYGICTGTETYTSIFGASITIPSINAEKVILGK